VDYVLRVANGYRQTVGSKLKNTKVPTGGWAVQWGDHCRAESSPSSVSSSSSSGRDDGGGVGPVPLSAVDTAVRAKFSGEEAAEPAQSVHELLLAPVALGAIHVDDAGTHQPVVAERQSAFFPPAATQNQEGPPAQAAGGASSQQGDSSGTQQHFTLLIGRLPKEPAQITPEGLLEL
jgi:hypothetical protein